MSYPAKPASIAAGILRGMACLAALWIFGATPSARAQSSQPRVATGAVNFQVRFHPGETARYFFTVRIRTSPEVTSAAPADTPKPVARRYMLEGELVVSFAASAPGQPLPGSVHFENLRVEHWQSSADVHALEALVDKFQQAPLMLSLDEDGELNLTGGPDLAHAGPFAKDAATLEELARTVLIQNLADAPLALGRQRAVSRYPVRGVLAEGTLFMAHAEYAANVPIAGRPAAEIRLDLRIPPQPVPATFAGPQGIEDPYLRYKHVMSGARTLTYLFDPASRQVIYLNAILDDRASLVARNTDTDASVRIPETAVRVDHNAEISVRRAGSAPSPQLEADLAAFEKTLKAQSHAAPPPRRELASRPDESLGEVARRLRAERGEETPIAVPAVTTPGAAPAIPPGFKTYEFAAGHARLLVPLRTMELRGRGSAVTLLGRTASDQPSVSILLDQKTLPPGIGTREAVQSVASSMLERFPHHEILKGTSRGFENNSRQVFQFSYSEAGSAAQQAWMGVVISGTQGTVVTCTAPAADTARVTVACQTVVESLRAR